MNREPKPCRCKYARHQHGTLVMYVGRDRCRCTPCREAWRDAQRATRRRQAYERWRGGRDRIRVDATGTRRRLQALATIGWACEAIAEELDRSYQVIWRQQNNHGSVTEDTANRVAALYDRLWDRPQFGNTAARVRQQALGKGWAVPLAWDDDTIDDPTAEPWTELEHRRDAPLDELTVQHIMAGAIRPSRNAQSRELTEAVMRLAAKGLKDAEIGVRVGRERDAVLKIRHRAQQREDAA